MMPPLYEGVMWVAAAVGLVSGVFFLTSWGMFHWKYGRQDRRKWSWARVDALLWVAVLTGFWVLTVVRVAQAGGWPYPGGVWQGTVVTVLSVGSSVALATRSIWWVHELSDSVKAVREHSWDE